MSPLIPMSKSMDRSQDVYSSVGYPLTSRMNSKVQNKNERWVVTAQTDEEFTAQRVAMEHEGDAVQPTVTVKFTAFHRHFEPGFCITTHAAQGDTIRTVGTIYDWNKMSTKLRYTAISRFSSADLVQINASKTHDNTVEIDYNFEEDVDTEDVDTEDVEMEDFEMEDVGN